MPPRVLFFAVTLGSLTLLAESVREVAADSEFSGQLYSALWVLNGVTLFILAALVVSNIIQLQRDYRKKILGSRLTLRLIALFASLAIVPTSIVFFFSLQFIRDGINQWTDSGVDTQLENALTLSRAAIDMQIREYKRRAKVAERQLMAGDSMSPLTFEDLRSRMGAIELTLFASNGSVPLFTSEDPGAIVPTQMPDAAKAAVRQGQDYVAVDPRSDRNMQVVVALPIYQTGNTQQHYLQALFPMSDRLNALAESVQSAHQEYKKKRFLNDPLMFTYSISLGVILLVTLMGAIWLAFYAAKRMAEPVRELAAGTRAVAQGDYSKQLNIATRDELGILVASFNSMTRRISQARDDVTKNQRLLESQRAYSEAILSCLSSGVITLDSQHHLRTANPRARQILGADLSLHFGERVDTLIDKYPMSTAFFHGLVNHVSRTEPSWTEQLQIKSSGHPVELICSGSRLSDERGQSGYVIVFDDISTLLRAQKDAAWGDVARRLAHEIKNPLTPIQLSAERLQHKLSKVLDAKHVELVEKSTSTIVSQVGQMKTMVNAFAEYAKAPELMPEILNMNHIIDDVVNLYRSNSQHVMLQVDLDADLPEIRADSGRIRQLLHNLIKNALEALHNVDSPRVTIATDKRVENEIEYAQLAIWDNGPGFPQALLGPVFEPYVTTKERGTGLGLAIVQKIVEEHGAAIVANNRTEGGAELIVSFVAYQSGETNTDV